MADDELMAAFADGAASEEKTAATPQNAANAQVPQADNDALAQKFLEQLQKPVVLRDGDFETINHYCNDSRIGPLKHNDTASMSNQDKEAHVDKPNLQQPKDLLKRDTVKVIRPGEEGYDETALAFCQDGKIILQDIKGDINENDSLQTRKYKEGDSLAKVSAVYHELAHLKHEEYDHYKELTRPVDIFRGNELSEKIGTTVQYQNAANLYTILKKQNVTQIELDGKVKPIESILEPFEGLKEYMTQNSYSPDNKKDVRAVTEIATKWWNENRADDYRYDHIMNACSANKTANIFEALESNKEQYDAVAKGMLKDLYIGNNTNVDLSHCRDLLDDISEEQVLQTFSKMPNGRLGSDMTFAQISKLSEYLETKGLHSNDEKMAYLRENYDHIVLRDGKHDEGLKQLLLSMDGENKGTIIYADGLVEHYDAAGNRTIEGKEGKANITTHTTEAKGNEFSGNSAVPQARTAEIPADDKILIAALSGRSGRYQSSESLQADALQTEQTIDTPAVAPASQEVTQQAQTAQPQQAQPAPQQAVAEAQPTGKKVKDMSPQEKHEFINDNLRMGNNPNLSGESKKSRKKTKAKARTIDNTVTQAQTLQAGR